ncbi:maltase 1 [Fopius arisanus]|uniref:alpha-glucosidase n=2 Tax=Fopius arisanus TaxID=64838 RepID=A0A0C9RDM0_9HYME|nr:PREDICTED: maltase 1-like [Fopius arisanus]
MARLPCVIVFLIATRIVAGEIKNVGWWKNAVFYQIYPRSFQDDNNDGIGDLKGITKRLDHFKETGIDAVWLSPIYASPMVDFGYDISDFRKIHPDYGTDADFTELISTARKLGIKVIMDLVPNHTSDEHEWFQKSLAGDEAYKDYYIWHDKPTDGKPLNNWISVFGGSAWNCSSSRPQCYFHQFHYKQPDLNFRSDKVQEEMKDIIRFWLDKGIDGFRVDAIPHLFEVEDLRNEPRTNLPGVVDGEYAYLDHFYTKDQPETYDVVKSWVKLMNDYANASNTDEKVMTVEAYTFLNKTTEYYETGCQIPFNFYFITDVNRTSGPDQFKKVIDQWLTEIAGRPGAVANWVLGNHDGSRTASRYPGRGDQMTMLAMILPGVAVTYYGEEIGMIDKTDISYEDTQDPAGCNAGREKYKEKSRDPVRTPMQWNDDINAGFNQGERTWIPVNENFVELNLAAQKTAKFSHYKIYKKLIHLRKTHAALLTGKVETFVSSDKKILSVVRSSNTESIILIINFSDTETVTVNLVNQVPSIAAGGLVEVATLDSPINEGSSVNLRKLPIAPKQSLVISAKIQK